MRALAIERKYHNVKLVAKPMPRHDNVHADCEVSDAPMQRMSA